MSRAHFILTIELDCVSADKLDKRKLRAWLNESIAHAGAVSIWDAHVKATIEPGGRVVEWDLEGLDGTSPWGDPL